MNSPFKKSGRATSDGANEGLTQDDLAMLAHLPSAQQFNGKAATSSSMIPIIAMGLMVAAFFVDVTNAFVIRFALGL